MQEQDRLKFYKKIMKTQKESWPGPHELASKNSAIEMLNAFVIHGITISKKHIGAVSSFDEDLEIGLRVMVQGLTYTFKFSTKEERDIWYEKIAYSLINEL